MSTVQGMGAGAEAGSACRVYPRHDCELPGTCSPLMARTDSGMIWAGWVRDISLGGVGLTLSRRFEPGAVLALELNTPINGLPQRLLVKVVRVKPGEANQWHLGCLLLSRLSQDKLQTLLSVAKEDQVVFAPAAPPTDEGVQQDVVFVPVPRKGGVGTFRARRLHVRDGWPPAPGTNFVLGLNGKHRGAVRLRLVVRECSRKDAGWVLRYELLEEPSPAALQLLRGRRR